MRIVIDDGDNKPLKIDSIQVRGYEHSLLIRFTDSGRYFLAYGNAHPVPPDYDISRFADKIPENLKMLSLGEEKSGDPGQISKPWFNKFWLWGIILLVMLVLGTFTVGMMKKK